ncbi:MAG: redoxin family protein [Oligoflexus sp.]
MVKSFLRRHLPSLAMFLVILLSLEWWQARNMTKGQLPIDLLQGRFPTLTSDSRELWSKDQLTLLYVFAPWCGVCRISASNINSLATDKIMVHALALSWQTQADVEEFVEETEMQTPVILGPDFMSDSLGLSAFPSYYLINESGEVIKTWTGYTTQPSLWLRTRIAQLLLHF